MTREKINILGLNIDKIDKKQVLEKINSFLKDIKPNYIVTPNPEIILKALDDEELFYIINKADLSIPDGIGIKFASFILGKKIKRITGSDLTLEILKIAENRNLKVAVLNLKNGLSSDEEIKEAVIGKYNKIKLEVFSERGDEDIVTSISGFEPDILFVATGFPYQEKFISKNLNKIKNLKLAIGVGGSFDFVTKKIKRAPKIMRILGLEWFWRLLKQPKRIKRIIRAVFVFPCKFLVWKFILPFIYRPNVISLLYKKEGDDYKILLVERKDEKDYWQLLQGGRDGQSLEEAGFRELKEEINSDKFNTITTISAVHKYKFDKSNGKYKTNMHVGYRGQKQGLFIAEFTGNDEDIKINFWDHNDWKWIDWNNLDKEVHSTKQEAMGKVKKHFKRIIINKE